ncbi:MAG TPA: winged helix-turn-helix transcriptional regulator, partial [Nitrososphaeraceae archaeon]|nr:winged helix-turn-helix transcriptional regulator [Nitrososphaeraceae archaeon]
MPLKLDDYDVSILKSLLKDGRKSFREISRETNITTPTVKARFNRLVNVGFIKSVSPILNFDIVEQLSIGKSELQIKKKNNNNQADKAIKKEEYEDEEMIKKKLDGQSQYQNQEQQQQQQQQLQDAKLKIKKGMKIKLNCEFCKGPVSGNLHVFRFANYERFFCCTGCMSGYKTKYAG